MALGSYSHLSMNMRVHYRVRAYLISEIVQSTFSGKRYLFQEEIMQTLSVACMYFLSSSGAAVGDNSYLFLLVCRCNCPCYYSYVFSDFSQKRIMHANLLFPPPLIYNIISCTLSLYAINH